MDRCIVKETKKKKKREIVRAIYGRIYVTWAWEDGGPEHRGKLCVLGF